MPIDPSNPMFPQPPVADQDSRFVGPQGQQTPTAPTPHAYGYNSKEDQPDESQNNGAPKEMSENDRARLATAHKRFQQAAESEAEQRRDALDDLKFRIGDQWPLDIKNRRDADGRPCLTINRIPQFLRQVTNQQKATRPGIQVNPVGEGASPKVAEIIEGLIRHIESRGGECAYDTAFEAAATTGGPGWIRVITDYIAPDSFDQEIYITRVLNQFSVYCDPNFQMPDGSDMEWVFVVEDLSVEDYKRQYPNTQVASLSEFASIGDRVPGWLSTNNIRVAEYWYKDYEERVLCRLQDGSSKFLDELPQGAQVIDQRSAQYPRIKWMRINGAEIIAERQDYKGTLLPFIPVLGDECVVEGKRKLSGVVRFAKDPQRAYNYWTSAETEAIALAPRAPFIAAEGQLKNHQKKWAQANNRNFASLEYDPVSLEGHLVPSPARAQFEPAIQAIALARAQAADDLKATTGIYDASLGAQGNEQSGRAILARQREGDISNAHLANNLSMSIAQTGRVCLDLIPWTYDRPGRIQRIIGRNMEQRMINVQSSRNPNVPPQPQQPGIPDKYDPTPEIKRVFDVGVGRYDVVMSAGASYQTRRQEAAASMLQLLQSFPQIAVVAGDLMVRNMDWPGADEIADRLKKMLPPQLQDEDQSQPKLPPQVQAAMAALQQQHDQLTQIVHKLLDERDTKVLELASKERIAALTVQGNLVMTEAKLQAQAGIEMLRQEVNAINSRLEYLAQIESTHGMESADTSAVGGSSQPGSGVPGVVQPPPPGPGSLTGLQPGAGPSPAAPNTSLLGDVPPAPGMVPIS